MLDFRKDFSHINAENIDLHLIHAPATRPWRLKDKNPEKAKTTWQDRAAEIQGRRSGKYQAIWTGVSTLYMIQCAGRDSDPMCDQICV